MKRLFIAALATNVALGFGCGAPASRDAVPSVSAGASAAPGGSAGVAQSGAEDTASFHAIDLLGKHLTVKVPPAATTAPRGHSIMSAPAADEDETRVVLEAGSGELARFVMLASELDLLGTGDIVADATKFAGAEGHASKLDGTSLPAAIVEPNDRSTKPNRPIFVMGLVVAHPDGTLQELDFYILEDMRSELEKYKKQADAIARTIGAGARKMDRSARPVDVGNLKAQIPKDYVVVQQRGPDFDVFHLRKLVHAGENSTSLGIYSGGHPSYQYKQQGGSIAPTESKGKLVGKPATWYAWSTPSGTRVREAIVEVSNGESIHVFALAADEAALAETTAIADSLKTK